MPQNILPDTHTGITADLVRKSRRHITGAFDPNEDPVIIGAGAYVTDGSSTGTPDDPNGGTFANDGIIVIGSGAYVDATTGLPDSAIVIGRGSNVTNNHGIALGDNCTAYNYGDVAIGASVSVDGGGDGSVGIGSNAFASVWSASVGGSASAGERCVAVGWDSDAHGQPSVGSVAIGYRADAHNPEGGVAIGDSATINSGTDRTTVVGAGATATSSGDSVVIGNSASDGGFSQGAAIGSGAVNTDSYQVMLGGAGTACYAEVPSENGYVLPSPDGTRWRITVTNAGTLSVALA